MTLKIIVSTYKKRNTCWLKENDNSTNNNKKERRFRKLKGKRKVITVEEAYPKLVDKIFNKLWRNQK
jgi:hypothetical protein